MGDPLFLLDALADPLPEVGTAVHLDGAEGRHAAMVRRIMPGETILIGDGRGRAVRGAVSEVLKTSLVITVAEQVATAEPVRRYVAVQALPKGDRAELAVEMLTEVGPTPAERARVYVCGPPTFAEAAAEALVQLGHEPHRVKTERFGPTGE